MDVLDSAVTVLLFMALLSWVWVSVIVGVTSVMLSDSGTPGVAWSGVLLAVVGVPGAVIAAYVTAVIAAVRADGPTFYYPLVAVAVGTVAAALLWALGYGIVTANLALLGTDEERRRRPPRPSRENWRRRREAPVEPETVPEVPAGEFTYTAIHRIADGGMTIEVGVERHTGRRYLRTPMPRRGGEYEEYYGIDVATYATFGTDHPAARRFAAECRDGAHRNLWLPPAGFPALQPISPDHTRLRGKSATLMTDRPTTGAGVSVTGLPPGTPFVRIVDDTPDRNGDLGVTLPAGDGEVVRVAAVQLGRLR